MADVEEAAGFAAVDDVVEGVALRRGVGGAEGYVVGGELRVWEGLRDYDVGGVGDCEGF